MIPRHRIKDKMCQRDFTYPPIVFIQIAIQSVLVKNATLLRFLLEKRH